MLLREFGLEKEYYIANSHEKGKHFTLNFLIILIIYP